MNGSFATADFIVIAIYFIFILGVGFIYSKKIKKADDYIVAGRSLTTKIMVGTTVATCMGAGSCMADVGFVYSSGLSAVLVIITFNIGWIALILMAKRLRASGAATLPDFLQQRFATSTKAIAGVVTLVLMLSTTAAQMSAAGTIMETLGLTSKTTGIYIGFVVILLITIAGGLYSVAITDALQAILLTIGCAIIVPIVAFAHAGGVGAVIDTVQEVNPDLLTLNSVSIVELVGYMLVYMLTAGSHACYAQRIMASIDEKTAFRGSIISNISSLVIALPIALTSLAAYRLFPEGINGEMTVPLIVSTLFPPIIKGFVMAALIALVISTADSFLLLLGTTAANDIYGLLKPEADAKKQLLVCRIFTFGGALIALYFAIHGGSIFNIMRTGGAAYGAGMFIPLVCACFWKKATVKGVNIGMITGCFTTLVWNLTLKASTGINGVIIGAAFCLAIVVIVSMAYPEKQRTIA